MKQIKLIATDIDGTLISSNMQLSDKNKEALDLCYKEGIKIVAATGRTYESIPEFVREHEGIEYIVCANGSAIYAGHPRILHHSFCLSPEAVYFAEDIINNSPVVSELSYKGCQYITEENLKKLSTYGISETVMKYITSTRRVVDNLMDFAESIIDEIEQISFCFSKEEEREFLYEKLSSSDLFVLTSAWSFNYEIHDHKAGKANGVSYICEQNNISPEEVLAIGNNDNDIDMINYAGIGVAVEDSSEETLKAAQFIAKPCREDGFAETVYRFVI